MKKYISEFLGSAFLFCAVVGSGIMAQNLTNDESIILFINSIITFFALYFLISGFNEYSNHFNPAVIAFQFSAPRYRKSYSLNFFVNFSGSKSRLTRTLDLVQKFVHSANATKCGIVIFPKDVHEVIKVHSSQIQGLCWMKSSSKMLQKLLYF